MKPLPASLLTACAFAAAACSTGTGAPASPAPSAAVAATGALAQIYYWRAKPGKFDEYTRYIREHAEPIDGEAQRQGAFVSVTTYMTRDTLGPWTHMRVFILRDSLQLQGLSAALSAAGMRLEPDSVKRRQAGEYSSGLRDGAGSATVAILR
jgi:hypothetical protein